MKKTLLAIAMTTAFTLPSAFAATLESEDQKLSYVFGLMTGQQMKPAFEKLDVEAFSAAIKDIYADAQLQLDEAEIEKVFQKYQTEMAEKQRIETQKANAEIIAKNTAAGTKFLAENGKRDGVQTTESGLQIEILEKGEGAAPKAEDTVVVHYTGKTLEGVEFDSSVKRNAPATFGLANVIPGWTEGLQLLHEGGKAKLYIPAQLAYGDAGASGVIEPGSTLIFDVELIEIKKPEAAENKEADAKK